MAPGNSEISQPALALTMKMRSNRDKIVDCRSMFSWAVLRSSYLPDTDTRSGSGRSEKAEKDLEEVSIIFLLRLITTNESLTHLPEGGLAAAKTEVLDLSMVVIPALAMEIVCCSMACRQPGMRWI